MAWLWATSMQNCRFLDGPGSLLRENAIILKRQCIPDVVSLFASPALLIQENLDLLMAIKFWRHEEAVHNEGKRLPKTESEQKQM